MTTNRGAIAGLDKRVTPARPDLAAAYLRGVVTAPRYVQGEARRVVVDATPLRSEPNPEHGYDTQVLYGEAVQVYEFDEEGWAFVQLDRDRYVGYVSANALAPVDVKFTHRVRTPRTFMYPARSIKTSPIRALPMLARVSVRAIDGAFAQIEDGGYVWADHLAPLDEVEPDFVSVAERFERAPYLWGGKTWDGADCSGLIQIALQAAGIDAPRDTDMQATSLGAAIDPGANFEALRRGDLVFWKGHVGVMCDANILLHANGHHMQVAREPFALARERIAKNTFGEVTCVRRL
jgi:cell wall-associated NlpC family hydrolase